MRKAVFGLQSRAATHLLPPPPRELRVDVDLGQGLARRDLCVFVCVCERCV